MPNYAEPPGWPSGSGRVARIASDATRVGSSVEADYASCKAGLVTIFFRASDDAAFSTGQFLSVPCDLTMAG